ncbi:MAG TPA: hypothetical protein VIY27_07820 [Myxococcota bacterium]
MELGVAIASNGRCGPFLRHVVADWIRRGAQVAVAGGPAAVDACQDLSTFAYLRLIEMGDRPEDQGDQIAAAMNSLDPDFVLIGADDILPVGAAWIESLTFTPGSIRSVRLIDMLGRRWFDWSCRTETGTYLQGYEQHHPRTFITGGSQLFSREARDAVSYEGRPYRTGADAQICEDAEAAGIQLLPPDPRGPLLVHLDRRPEHIRWRPDAFARDIEV